MYVSTDYETAIFTGNRKGQTFLHLLAETNDWRNLQCINKLPRDMIISLCHKKDHNNQTAADLTTDTFSRVQLKHAAADSINFYHLLTPPQVLIFYCPDNNGVFLGPKLPQKADQRSENITNTLEKYFTSKNYPCSVFRNPTATEIFSSISAATDGSNIAGLMVFLLSQPFDGVLRVKGIPSFVSVDDLITQMSPPSTRDVPKVSFFAAH